MLESILQTGAAGAASAAVALPELLLCTAASLTLGLCVAAVYMHKNVYSKSFVVTLALMPAMVQAIIMLVNGNLGAGVAVMGAFSLVRFRSAPGNARDIGCIFFAMAVGLATGMGYLLFAALFTVGVGAAMLLLTASPFGSTSGCVRTLKIIIPEHMDYDGIFDDLFELYTSRAELLQVRTTNMGSLYELQYRIELRDGSRTVPKEFVDALRCRNGNLNISCAKISANKEAL